MMTDYLEDELEMLTPQEREALESEPEAPADNDAIEGEAVTTETTDDVEHQAAQPDEVQTQSDDADEPKENTIEEQGKPQAATPPIFPTFDAPQDAQARLSQIEEDFNNIGLAFEEGSLTGADYQRQMLQLMNEKIELREQIFKSSLSQEVHEKTWFEVTVPAFLDAHPQYRENEILFDSLNSQVRRLQGENSDKPFSPDILVQAHAKLATVFNFGAVHQEQAVAPTQAALQPQREMPPNIGSLPAADMTATADGGLFRHLDKLADENVEKYEEELAKLPEEQLEAYLKFA